MLKTFGLAKAFGDNRAVDELTVDIPTGQMVGVIGRSGAGKSTFLRLVNRLADPTAGRIFFGESEITSLKGQALREWRAQCAMIFQQFNLVNRLDVITNVLIGRIGYRSTLPTLVKHFTAEERALAIRALDRLDMAPQALQRADTLSGGQQQRVAIARALVQEPNMILADEPIASLDPTNAERVMEALRRINREDGITVLCNLHHIDAAKVYCDRIIGMSAGRVVFDGLPAELGADQVRAIFGTEDTGRALDQDRGAPQPVPEAAPDPVAAVA